MQKNIGDLDRTAPIVASLELVMMAVTGLADMFDNGIEKTSRLAVLPSAARVLGKDTKSTIRPPYVISSSIGRTS